MTELMSRLVLTSCLLILYSQPNAQQLPDLLLPVQRDIKLSGSFGELRSNHFHAGIDIRSSRGVSGDPIHAVDEGYVSRIMIHPTGYGNALMVTHPGGYTTVYAHLDAFEPSIAARIREYQHRFCSAHVDFDLSPSDIPVTRDQLIGYMGNTGYSFGPHLHFEVRRDHSGMLVNPMLLGRYHTFQDNIPPVIYGIRLYGLDEERRDVQQRNIAARKKGGIFTIPGDTVRVPAHQAALAINTIDFMNGSGNRNGIYKLELYVDDSLYFHYQMDSFARADTRYLNAHTDYQEYFLHGRYYHRLHRLPGNFADLYPFQRNDGIIPLDSGQPRNIRILSSDYHGNFSLLSFVLITAETKRSFREPDHQYKIRCLEETLVSEDSCKIHFPAGTFYEDLYLRYRLKSDSPAARGSATLSLLNAHIPVHKYFRIGFLPRDIPDQLKSKAFVASIEGNRYVNHGGVWEGDILYAEVRHFGSFCLQVDTLAPVIRPQRYQEQAERMKDFLFYVSDNVTAGREVPKWRVDVYIDDEWRLTDYSPASGNLRIPLGDIGTGTHALRIEAEDSQGNMSIWTSQFSR